MSIAIQEVSVEQQYEQQRDAIYSKVSDLLLERIQTDKGNLSEFCREAGLSHPQLDRIQNHENYTIDTMLKALHTLGYDLVIETIID